MAATPETPQAMAARVRAIFLSVQTEGTVSVKAVEFLDRYVHAVADECDRLGRLLEEDARVVRDSVEADRRLWSGDVWGPNDVTILCNHFGERIAALPADEPDKES